MIRFLQWLCIVCVLIPSSIIPAQEWVARYNGPVNGFDGALAIAVDNAGNIYVIGSSYGSGTGSDYATVKYSDSGVEQWVARYDGPVSENDYGRKIAIDNAGSIYVTGSSYGSGTGSDYATVKYNVSGVEQWVARYNGPGNGLDVAGGIAVDSAGSIYVTGRSEGSGTGSDYATVKYSDSGVEQWVARYDGPVSGSDRGGRIALDNAGNVYVTGTSEGSGTGDDYATVKYNASGVEQWVTRYHYPDSDFDAANAIAIDNTGNIYVTGASVGSGTGSDIATVKYNDSGVEQWVARYNGPGDGDDGGNAIAIDNTGNIYVTGSSDGSYTTSHDYTTVKYNDSGVEQWVVRYNGTVYGIDWAYAIAVDNVCDIYVTGTSVGSGTDFDYATVKYSDSGVEQWVVRYNEPGEDWAHAIAVDSAGNIYVTGRSYGSSTGDDYATIKYSPTGILENELAVKNKHEITVTIFRGPLQLPEGKECKVFDITGRVVEPNMIRPGIYFIEVDGVVTQKVVKVR